MGEVHHWVRRSEYFWKRKPYIQSHEKVNDWDVFKNMGKSSVWLEAQAMGWEQMLLEPECQEP